jgi:hypothetical protein
VAAGEIASGDDAATRVDERSTGHEGDNVERESDGEPRAVGGRDGRGSRQPDTAAQAFDDRQHGGTDGGSTPADLKLQ